MKLWIVIFALWPVLAFAQTRAVDPADLILTVTLEDRTDTPFRQEMVLMTIHGVYRRHITLEQLEQPDFKGFNWMQLGQDHWYESMQDGRPVKNFRRRMAVFPHATGRLEIGSFRHRLTLLDEDYKWFEHTITSEPVVLEVAPEPAGQDWWFPVRGLEVSDNWSNAPDQLRPGEGVLRIVRISALGASPDMIPPMPDLTSPSALIFAHPEKRLVDLTPEGPRAIAFWRWTITPTNGRSAVLEPVSFDYYDVTTRQMRDVKITAERVAFIDAPLDLAQSPVVAGTLRTGWMWAGLMLGIAAAIGAAAGPGRALTVGWVRAWLRRRWLIWTLMRSARRNDLAAMRYAARALSDTAEQNAGRSDLLQRLDSAIFGTGQARFDAIAFCRNLRAGLGPIYVPAPPPAGNHGHKVNAARQ